MRTAITLYEFIFTLNQDEDMRVTIIDYERDKRLYSGWKSEIQYCFEEGEKYMKWFVQDFVLSAAGIELTIVELPEELEKL